VFAKIYYMIPNYMKVSAEEAVTNFGTSQLTPIVVWYACLLCNSTVWVACN